MSSFDFGERPAKECNFVSQSLHIEKAGFQGVVEVGGVVGDFVDAIDELGFERRAKVEEIFGKVGKILLAIIARMLDDAFANFEGQVEAGKIHITLFEMLDD